MVAERKVKGLHGSKFLLIQPVDDQLEENGDIEVAVDAGVQAGEGDLVYRSATEGDER